MLIYINKAKDFAHISKGVLILDNIRRLLMVHKKLHMGKIDTALKKDKINYS